MGEPVVTTPESMELPKQSVFQRFVGVFVSPGETFADIARHPDFLAPLIAGVVGGVALTETMLAKVGMDRIVRISLEQSGRASNMTPEQIEQAVHRGGAIAAIITHIAGFLGPLIYMLIIAALGLFIANVIFGGQTKFKTCFSVSCYAYLVSWISFILGIVIILFGDLESFNPQNFVPTNLGFFLNPRETSKALYAMATSLDVISFWFLALVSLGLSFATKRKAKTVPVFLTFVGFWAIWVLAKVGWAMLMG